MNKLGPALRLLGLLWLLGPGTGHAGCMDTRPLRGVNLSGAEFSNTQLPGTLHKDYTYPADEDLRYFQQVGMGIIRLPFRWERIQHEPHGPLDTTELAELQRVVSTARALKLCILLDLHNFGSYRGQVLGSPALPGSALTNVWLQLQRAFPDPDTTALGLMNEPAPIPVAEWTAMAQETVLALRAAGARNLILVPSGRWSGAHEWHKRFEGVTPAESFQTFQDPLDNYAIELHQYADADFSGTGSLCLSATHLRQILERVTSWAIQERKKLFLGEFGMPPSAECLLTLTAMLQSMQDTHAWLGWTYWSAGRWWGTYPYSIHPGRGPEAPQLTVLRTFLGK
ncbi:cellulase [Hylemonella gracilis str. Niagara R]|uniref:Cellulase n=1 Tax=Hylemonella gracilis str. Niagara R TaxID=1458275 RepID=A0A016XK85_9BURK|nr:glycoside hydrolase family 5 protein [Hylemonella gracilis]EYC51967.1 cellulase [Hylemonella gracilis str. Niagara R]